MVFHILALLAALAIGATQAAAADKLVVAVNKLSAGSPLYIARAKGFSPSRIST
jgi:ABC-type nitrate/sulfonate/bicarbonate transport system substrate-binding protein